MVAGNASPICNPCRAVLVTAGIASIGIALDMTDENRQICFKHVFIHENRISPVRKPQIHHMLRILGIMADDLPAVPERIINFPSKKRQCILVRTSGMQAIGDNKQDILLFHSCRIQVIQYVFYRQLSVAGGLLPAFYAVRYNKNNFASLMNQLLHRRHADRMIQALPVSCLQLFLRYIRRIRYGHSRDKHVRAVRKIRSQCSLSILKFKVLHFLPPDFA